MNKILIMLTVFMLSACSGTNRSGDDPQLTQDSKSATCSEVKSTGKRLAKKKRCPNS